MVEEAIIVELDEAQRHRTQPPPDPAASSKQPEQEPSKQRQQDTHYFSNLLKAVNAANVANENTNYFKTMHREYNAVAETLLQQQCSEFLSNKRRWGDIGILDIEVKRQKTELDKVTKAIAALDDERAIIQMRHERAAKRVSMHIDLMMKSVRAKRDGGLLSFAHSTRECVICRETKRETSFVWNVVCSHSPCFVCLKTSRDSGVRTCMICRVKQPQSSFLVLCESRGCRFVATPM